MKTFLIVVAYLTLYTIVLGLLFYGASTMKTSIQKEAKKTSVYCSQRVSKKLIEKKRKQYKKFTTDEERKSFIYTHKRMVQIGLSGLEAAGGY